MKSSSTFQVLNRKLVKFWAIIFVGLSFTFSSFSNPIEIPPTLLEIYFGPSGYEWSIEMMLSEYIGAENLDEMRITGLNGTAQFNPGIEYTPNLPFIITPDDFQTSLFINPAGDFLLLEFQFGDDWWPVDYFGLPFGDFVPVGYHHSEVSAPVGEESIAWQKFSYPDSYDYFWTVKELPNTIGSNPFQVSKRATFNGYVKDENDEPLAGIKLYYCPLEFHFATIPTVPELFTDSEGYFATDNMFCKKYDINFLYEGSEIGDTTVSIEPDSSNYFEFKLDTLLTGINDYKPVIPGYSIYNIPNPSSSQTKIIIESNHPEPGIKGVVKIYSEPGYIVDILPVEIKNKKEEVNYYYNEKSLSSGLYFYSLEIRNQKVASGKMLITR